MGQCKFFQGQRRFSNGHCDLIPLHIFLILISINIKVLLILHIKFQPNKPSRSGKMVILIVLLFLVMAAILNSRPD